MAKENGFLSEIKSNIKGLHELNTLAETHLESGEDLNELKQNIYDAEMGNIFSAMAAYCM